MRFRPAIFAVALLAPGISAPVRAARPEDAARLFRDEVIDAPARLGWKGPALSDETRFAVAATGLTWQPAVDGAPLIVHDKHGAAYADAETRYRTFAELRRSDRKKEAFAWALSLLLDPPSSDSAWVTANDYLSSYGPDVDKALVGVLQAPEKLPLLPTRQYAAMDSLTRRGSPRLLPLFLTLAESSDRYLRSRAIAALGIIDYHAGPNRDTVPGLLANPRESSISAVQERLISEQVRRAATDSNWRVRAAAALALGLMRDDNDALLLEKLARDRAYISTGAKSSRTVVYPVRQQADAALARFNRQHPIPAEAQGRDADKLARGGQDVRKDASGIRRDQQSRVRFVEAAW